jgi:iron complex outermembrane receptor protein
VRISPEEVRYFTDEEQMKRLAFCDEYLIKPPEPPYASTIAGPASLSIDGGGIRGFFCPLFAIVLCLLNPAGSQGQSMARTNISDFSNISLEELINIEVTSVGKKETTLLRSPAAIAVLTQDDLRRLGATSIPEALRAVPGLQVARISGNRWAITSRGFNDEYSNKLLVLVDGRTVYTPTFGGVYWNAQDLVLEDLDRIEVIRGPGATLWGANAVNGVINIITKSARETQGGLISTTGGTEDQPSVSARWGGQLSSNVYYRVYAKYFNREGFDDAQGRGMSDDWRMARGGVRLDWEASEQNTFTLLGDYHGGVFNEQVGKIAAFPTPDFRVQGIEAETSGGNILGRWTSRFSEESELKLQVYYDHYEREDPYGGGVVLAAPNEFQHSQNRMDELRDTWDVDLQHRFAVGGRNDVVWGLGYRRTEDSIDSGGAEIFWSREHTEEDLFSAFVQDEITVVEDRLWLTLGTKLERNDYTGLEVQPAGRLMWAPAENQTVWASIARAVRMPTRLERDARVNIGVVPGMVPVLISSFPNSELKAEELLAYELGYRFEPTRCLSFDLAGFYNRYELLTSVPRPFDPVSDFVPVPVPHFVQPYESSRIDGHTYGTELLVQWKATDRWRLTAGYTWMQSEFDGDPLLSLTHPEHQVHLRSNLDLGRGWEVNAAGYFVDSIKSLPQGREEPVTIDSYIRIDLGLSWRLNERLEFSLWGQNLLDAGHPEFASYKTPNIAQIPRSFFGKFTLQF